MNEKLPGVWKEAKKPLRLPWWLGALILLGCALLLTWSRGELHF